MSEKTTELEPAELAKAYELSRRNNASLLVSVQDQERRIAELEQILRNVLREIDQTHLKGIRIVDTSND